MSENDENVVVLCSGCGGCANCPKVDFSSPGFVFITDDYGGKVQLTSEEYNTLLKFGKPPR